MTALSGARVAVVGASGGLGSEISRHLARRGARLLLAARDAERLRGVGIPETSVAASDFGP